MQLFTVQNCAEKKKKENHGTETTFFGLSLTYKMAIFAVGN